MQQVLKHQNLLDNSDIDQLDKVPTDVNSLKGKVDKLDVDKLVPVPGDLSQLSDVVDVVTKDAYNAKIKDIEDTMSDITNSATNTTFNNKINEVKKEKPSINSYQCFY